jgi:hypothetical protein
MSKYKKIVKNELELEVDELKVPVYLNMDTRYEALELLQSQTKEGLPVRKVGVYLSKVLTEGHYEHNANGERGNLREGYTQEDIKDVPSLVSTRLIDLWTDLLEKANLISKKKSQEIIEKQKEATKN